MKNTQTRWILPEKADADTVTQLAASLNISVELTQLLHRRNIRTFEEAKAFFRPQLSALHDPFLMQDMDKAVNRLTDAVFNGNKILIYGDYDVDGATSVSLVYLFLKNFTTNLEYYIPDRYTEGYGVSEKGMRYAADNGFDLVITLDCGIKGNKNLSLAKSLGLDVIVCDHHNPGETLPDALAVLDPKRSDCQYPYKELSGCGVGFKLLQGFCFQQSIPLSMLFQYLDLVTVSIACDIVPITGENRILAYFGMKKINQQPLPGLKALMEIAGLKGELKVSDLVFYLGPRINAAGRLSHAKESVRLLICDDPADLEAFAAGLHKANQDRKEFDQNITKDALEMIAENYAENNSTVLYSENWHKGVIGIVASRCIEHYYRPTVILTHSNGKATGSARSVENFDLYEAIHACSDLLEQFGGHTHAAGLTLPLENIEVFRARFESIVKSTQHEDDRFPKLYIDLQIDLSFVNDKNFGVIKQMAPFGPHNMQPLFVTENLRLRYPPNILKETHLKLVICQDDPTLTFDAIGFGMGDLAERLTNEKSFSMVYQIEENNYQGNKSLQMIIKDIKFYD